MSTGYVVALSAVPFIDLLAEQESALVAVLLGTDGEPVDAHVAANAVEATRRRLIQGVDSAVRSLPAAVRGDQSASKAFAYALVALADERMLHHPTGAIERWRRDCSRPSSTTPRLRDRRWCAGPGRRRSPTRSSRPGSRRWRTLRSSPLCTWLCFARVSKGRCAAIPWVSPPWWPRSRRRPRASAPPTGAPSRSHPPPTGPRAPPSLPERLPSSRSWSGSWEPRCCGTALRPKPSTGAPPSPSGCGRVSPRALRPVNSSTGSGPPPVARRASSAVPTETPAPEVGQC